MKNGSTKHKLYSINLQVYMICSSHIIPQLSQNIRASTDHSILFFEVVKSANVQMGYLYAHR